MMDENTRPQLRTPTSLRATWHRTPRDTPLEMDRNNPPKNRDLCTNNGTKTQLFFYNCGFVAKNGPMKAPERPKSQRRTCDRLLRAVTDSLMVSPSPGIGPGLRPSRGRVRNSGTLRGRCESSLQRSVPNPTSARAAVATLTGCPSWFKANLGRWSALALLLHSSSRREGVQRESNPYLLVHSQTCMPNTPQTPQGK